MNILLLVPYYTGSHAAWADGFIQASSHHVTLLALTGAFWKWRMHGGAVTLARQTLERRLPKPDLILATDMLDLTTYLALTREYTHDIPTVLYMHENQLTYPIKPGEKRDLHYAFINYASMLAADRVFFNSRYHMESWFDELPRMLKHFPDYCELESIPRLQAKSEVLPVGIHLKRYDAFRPTQPRSGEPLILWNHRWDFDKNPQDFFNALVRLAGENLPFNVAIVGENYRQKPTEFEEGRAMLGERITHYGFVQKFEDYARLLWRADILPVTSLHDFFGISVVEAIYCDTFPIVSNRLTYPEYIPPALTDQCIYRTPQELTDKLRYALCHIDVIRNISLRQQVEKYDWSNLIRKYDERLADICNHSRSNARVKNSAGFPDTP